MTTVSKLSDYRRLKLKKLIKFPDFDDAPEKRRKIKKKKNSNRIRSITKAKTLTLDQFEQCVLEASRGYHPERDVAILCLSFYAGLRAQEIAGVQWKRNIEDAEGEIGPTLHITRDIGKRTKARFIPICVPLRLALQRLRSKRKHDKYVVYPLYERDAAVVKGSSIAKNQTHPNTLAQFLRRFYKNVGFQGCTSHSGRRTLITGMARSCNLVGASIRDVQEIAGHADINTTMGYVEESPHRNKLVQRGFS